MIRTVVEARPARPGEVRLSCLHVRDGDQLAVGDTVDCRPCDEARLPDGLWLVRTAGPFDEATLPAGLRRTHRVGASTWGVLVVRTGTARLTLETDPVIDVVLRGGDRQAIPPLVPHLLVVTGPFELAVELHAALDTSTHAPA